MSTRCQQGTEPPILAMFGTRYANISGISPPHSEGLWTLGHYWDSWRERFGIYSAPLLVTLVFGPLRGPPARDFVFFGRQNSPTPNFGPCSGPAQPKTGGVKPVWPNNICRPRHPQQIPGKLPNNGVPPEASPKKWPSDGRSPGRRANVPEHRARNTRRFQPLES